MEVQLIGTMTLWPITTLDFLCTPVHDSSAFRRTRSTLGSINLDRVILKEAEFLVLCIRLGIATKNLSTKVLSIFAQICVYTLLTSTDNVIWVDESAC